MISRESGDSKKEQAGQGDYQVREGELKKGTGYTRVVDKGTDKRGN